LLNATPPTEIYTLSLHDALPISQHCAVADHPCIGFFVDHLRCRAAPDQRMKSGDRAARDRDEDEWIELARNDRTAAADELHHDRSEEHTSELQSLAYLVCRLLLE